MAQGSALARLKSAIFLSIVLCPPASAGGIPALNDSSVGRDFPLIKLAMSRRVIPSVGRTHTIVRFQTRIRRKDGTENFGGFIYVLDGFPQRDFVLWVFVVFMCPINISLSCLYFCFFSVSIL